MPGFSSDEDEGSNDVNTFYSPALWTWYLGGDPVPPKLFLAPAKDGGAPPDVDGTGGAAAPSAASPSTLAGGRRMSAGKGGRREGRLH